MTRLIRAELFKLATTPGPWVLVLLTAGLTAAIISGLLAGGVGTDVDSLRSLLGAGHPSALFLAPIVGVLCITTEYRHKVLTTTLLTTPRRPQVLAAKAVASVAWSLLLGVTSLVVVAAMGVPWATAYGVTGGSLVDQIGPVVPGLLGLFVLFALLGLGLGTLVKNQVVGVVVIAGISFIEPILTTISYHLGYNLNWLPSEAAAAMVPQLDTGAFGHNAFSLLPWWLGALALTGWGVGTLVLGYFTTFRQDVT